MSGEDIGRLRLEKSGAGLGPPKRKKIIRWLLLIAAAVLAAVLAFTGVLTPALDVEVSNVVRIYPWQESTLLNASGYVVAQRKAAVASKITGRLVALNVEEGDRVKKGEVIARLESADAAALKDEAEANLRVARSGLKQAEAELHDADLSYRRSKDLLDRGYISRDEFDAAEARYKKAEAAVAAARSSIEANAASLRNAEVTLDYASIRSPFDAVVLTKNADIGDIITPLGAAANAKAAVVTIADMGSLQVEVDVAESNIEKIRQRQPCIIQLDAFPDLRFKGTVHMIVPTADRTKATVLVKVGFVESDPRILPEMSAKVSFLERPITPDDDRAVTALNPAAVVTRSGKTEVFLIRGDRAYETPVTLGHRIGEMVEVKSGVAAGDKVVLKPLEKLRNGRKIKTAEP
jgi:RND family efflux transporter MFP subunit